MYNAQEIEKEILELWLKKKIYEKSRKNNSGGKKFYMMDGPPYANGHIHIGHALNKTLKDISMRFKRLQGFDVFDKAGYDTHGVPIEFQIEKEIGSKSKKDIETYGVKKFIDRCRESATQYIKLMNSEFEDIGVWMDFENAYLTLGDNYVEAIWETFKKADEKKLLYLGKYPVHICPRCETVVAYNEIEYGKQEDLSVYVKFPIKNEKNKFLVIFTTTPWTLPGNTGVMVNPEFDYVELELSTGERWIIAKERVQELMSAIETGYTIKKTFKGKELEGTEYSNPLSKNLKLKIKKGYKVILSSRYVNLEEGTGLVHCAPGHGKEDYEVGKEYGIDMPSPVGINGILTEEAGKYSGKKARVVDAEIIEDLEKDKFLVYKNKYNHDYPLCWRCKNPLLMVSMPQWFFKISSIHKKILESNEKVNWVPDYMKLRMKAWLEGISDWPISRNRYWGTPLPIWICDKCDKKIVVGSVNELEKISKKKVKGIHKPEIDEVIWNCDCGGKIKRVSEVLDVWFDSGVSSWAALDYPREEKLFKKFWPADINIEGSDQVRGWWNSQIILSEIRFGKKPFENILVHGMVLDLGKKKMSKSIGNIISPQEIVKNYGRDRMRYYFAKTSKGEDFGFDENEVKEIEKIFMTLLNINQFIKQTENKKTKIKTEDKWILSKLNSVVRDVTESYEKLRYYEVVQKIEDFLINDFSKTYIKIIRERASETSETLQKINLDLLKILAPITPFITEKIWQELKKEKIVKEESIHLSSWPKVDNKKINEELENKFNILSQIIESGLRERDKAQIGLRWPLPKVVVYTKNPENYKELEEIIKSQLNVKKIEFKSPSSKSELIVELDTKTTPELEAEGYARELSRQIQAFRKTLGLEKKDFVETIVFADAGFKKILEKQKNFIKERTNSSKFDITFDDKIKMGERFKNNIEFKIKDKRGNIAINR